MNRVTTEQFIAKAVAVHGDKYGYADVRYVNNVTKVKLYCKKCKSHFYITPSRHLDKVKKCGCKCYIPSRRLSQEEFIKRCVEAHGTKYDYDETVYVTSKTRVKIYCKKCDRSFWQFPHAHIKGDGCRVCANKRRGERARMSDDEFIRRSKKIHGSRYGYDKMVYKGLTKKVTLFCYACGKSFKVKVEHHLYRAVGCRCHKPSQVRTTLNEFVKQARKVHGDRYDYSAVDYKGTKTKVKIYCKACAKFFWQRPCTHLLASIGCRQCATRVQAEKLTRTNEQFIREAQEVHGDRFGYQKVKYQASDKPVKIYCKKCKKFFMQAPIVHLKSKYGCSNCFYKTTRLGKEHFVAQAKKLHGDLFGYDKVKYTNARVAVKIYCNECNKYFRQKPEAHLKGCGCTRCYRNDKRAYTTESFIEEAKRVHGNNYQYDKTKYVQRNVHIDVYCNRCKTYFSQRPWVHLKYSGCPNGCYRPSKGIFTKAAKLFNVFVKGTFPYDTAGKRETTEIVMDVIAEHVGDDFNFLSMPGNGRELKYLTEYFNVNTSDSLGVEIDSTHFEVLRRLWQRLKLRLPMIKGNIDHMILDGLNRTFDVAHLDYNGFLTPKRQEAIDRLVTETPKHGLVFVTLNTNTRGLGMKYPTGKLPIDAGEIIMHQPYIGMRGAKMETFGIKAS